MAPPMTPTPPDLGALLKRSKAQIDTLIAQQDEILAELPDLLSHSTRQAARIVELEAALRPFAAIEPSSLYPGDGHEAEPYCILIAPISGNKVEFTGTDLARARNALDYRSGEA